MGQITHIEWTATRLPEGKYVKWNGEMLNVIPGATFNPWWGCDKVSPACKFCYAEYFSDVRYKNHHWGPGSTRREFDDKHWNEPLKWNRKAKEAGIQLKVFCGSMCDWAEDHPDVGKWRERLFQLIEATPHLIWLLLTKRPENIMRFIPNGWKLVKQHNVWFGTTVENQKYADERIPELISVPATARFLSCEPLLGPLNLSKWFPHPHDNYPDELICDKCGVQTNSLHHPRSQSEIDWVIVGGESGTKKDIRPMHPTWALDVRDQCAIADVKFFFKQWGEYVPVKWIPDDDINCVPLEKCVSVDLEGKIIAEKELIPKTSEFMARMGKGKSGRKLCGVEHNEMPDPKISLLSMINDNLL